MKIDEELERAVSRLALVVHERAVLQDHAEHHEELGELLAERERESLGVALAALRAAGYPTLELKATEEQERKAVEDPEGLLDELSSIVSRAGVRVHLQLKRSASILRRPTKKVAL